MKFEFSSGKDGNCIIIEGLSNEQLGLILAGRATIGFINEEVQIVERVSSFESKENVKKEKTKGGVGRKKRDAPIVDKVLELLRENEDKGGYFNGKISQEIAEKVGSTKNYVNSMASRYGFTNQGRKKKKIIKLIEKGKTAKEIFIEVGGALGYIYNVAEKNGLKIAEGKKGRSPFGDEGIHKESRVAHTERELAPYEIELIM